MQNSLRDSQAKLMVRSAIKWHKFHRINKIVTTLICDAKLAQHSKPVKHRKKTCFFRYSFTFLDGFEQLSAEATLNSHNSSHRKCSLCPQGNSVNTSNGENVHHITKLIINVTKVTLKSNCTMYNL